MGRRDCEAAQKREPGVGANILPHEAEWPSISVRGCAQAYAQCCPINVALRVWAYESHLKANIVV